MAVNDRATNDKAPVDGHRVRGDSKERVLVAEEPVATRAGRTLRYARDGGPVVDADAPGSFVSGRDRVRWGPVVAGLLTALTSLLILSLLGAAIGLSAMNAGTAAAQGGVPADAGRNTAIWGAIAGILAFLIGGFVAGRAAAVVDRGWGALNGALVFLLAVPIVLWLAGQGLGAALGTLGSMAGGFRIDPAQVQGAAAQAGQAAQNAQPIDVARAAANARNTAWGTLLGILVALAASALGGAAGTRRDVGVASARAAERDAERG